LRAIAVGQLARPVAELARAAAHMDEGRWMNEGGTVGPEPVAPLPAVAAMG
jgi:hypothetical protein